MGPGEMDGVLATEAAPKPFRPAPHYHIQWDGHAVRRVRISGVKGEWGETGCMAASAGVAMSSHAEGSLTHASIAEFAPQHRFPSGHRSVGAGNPCGACHC